MQKARANVGFGAECLQAFLRDTPADADKGDRAFVGAVLVADALRRM